MSQSFILNRDFRTSTDLDYFVSHYNPKNRHERKETDRFKSFTYEELIKRDPQRSFARTGFHVDLDMLTPSPSLKHCANLPDPGVLALEITEDLEAALAQFAEIAAHLKR